MRILFDENLPFSFFSRLLAEFEVKSVKDAGWSGIKNGALLKQIEGNFDIFITSDKNIRHQQNIEGRTFAIVEVYTNRLPLLKEIESKILLSIQEISGNEYVEVKP